MATLAIGSVLFGIFIGKFFRWPMLVPAFGLVIIFILINPAHAERTPQILFFQTAISIVSLQIGYVIGMFALNVDRPVKRSKSFRKSTPENPGIDWPRIW